MASKAIGEQALCTALESLRKKLWVRCALDCSSKSVLRKDEFISLCTSNPYAPASERLSEDEGMQLLQSLHNARQVMVVRDLVYVNPADVVNAVHVRLNLPYITNHVSALSEDSATPCDGLQVSAVAPREQDARRRLFWATASLLSSIQMTVLAYLTFVVYGWDVMEPICYFITTTTTLCSYAFGLRYKRSYSHEAVDSQIAASVAVEEGGKLKEDASGLLDGCGCSAIHDVNKPSFVEAVKILRGVQAECADEDFPPSTTGGAAARDGGGGLYRSL